MWGRQTRRRGRERGRRKDKMKDGGRDGGVSERRQVKSELVLRPSG